MALVIGILGGVASGKSTVARLMAEKGIVHVDADAFAHEVVLEPAVRHALEQRFGDDLYDGQGQLDRALLAKRAFCDENSTQELNSLIHPRVRQRIAEALAEAGERPVVLDVPLLLGSPLENLVTRWVYLETQEGTRDERAAGRNWAPQERARREALQADLTAKRARAHHVLENNGEIEDLGRRVDALLLEWGVPI